MRNAFRQLEQAVDKLGILGSIAIIFVAIVSVIEIFRRYVLLDPSTWATELIIAVAAGTYVMAGPYALLKHSHIEITVFSVLFPRWLASISELLKVICGFVYVGALAYGSFDMAMSSIQGGETLGGAWDVPIPQVTKSLLFIATILFLLVLSRDLVVTIRRIVTGAAFDAPSGGEMHD